MSGPKAFRIVTRAEIAAICRRSLARLDAAIEDWISRGQRNGTIDQADIDESKIVKDYCVPLPCPVSDSAIGMPTDALVVGSRRVRILPHASGVFAICFRNVLYPGVSRKLIFIFSC